MRTLMIVLLSLGLSACLQSFSLDTARVTPEHRQLKNKTGLIVFLDPLPRLQHLQLSALDSTTSTLGLTDWNANKVVAEYLTQRMTGMGLDVRKIASAGDGFPNPYDSSMAYPNLERMRGALGAWAAANDLDMVVAVYRQVEEDYIGESVENLIGYGVVRHEGARVDAFASIYVDAVDIKGKLVGNSDGMKSMELDQALWLDTFDVDKETVAVSGALAKQLQASIKQVLLDAVLLAAQEAGLSH